MIAVIMIGVKDTAIEVTMNIIERAIETHVIKIAIGNIGNTTIDKEVLRDKMIDKTRRDITQNIIDDCF